MPSPVPEGFARGVLLPIGGAMDLHRKRTIVRHFCQLAGADKSHVIIIPTASELPNGGEEYIQVFKECGVAQATVLPVRDRGAALDPAAEQAIQEASGIFLTGGNQLKLTAMLGGTPIATAIRRANARGVPVAGTSAGASAMSAHMIASGSKGLVPRYGMVQFAPGLGLTNRLVIDQHFGARHRLGRLVMAVSYNPYLLGIGLDEDTAAEIVNDTRLDVLGAGSVTIVDGSEISHTDLHQLRPGERATIVGVRMHVLTHGWSYDLVERQVIPPAWTQRTQAAGATTKV